jgi:predicted nucleotidyltransferase
MDVMDEELLEFWRKLNDNGVKYIVVGGLATRLHGNDRITDDLDMWIEDDLENRKSLRKSFHELQYGDFASLETTQFVAGWTSIYIAGIELDIITQMKGLENISFNECLQIAPFAEIEGVKIPFLHINHLIENKKAVNRPKDQIDVQELEKIKNIKEEK